VLAWMRRHPTPEPVIGAPLDEERSFGEASLVDADDRDGDANDDAHTESADEPIDDVEGSGGESSA